MPQRVDPFIPVSPSRRPKSAQLRGQYGQHLFGHATPTAPTRSGSIDGVRRSSQTPLQRRPTAQHQSRLHPTGTPLKKNPSGSPAQAKPEESSKFQRLWRTAQLPALVVAAIIVGLLVQSQLMGELAIGAYAVFALVRRIASRTTFLLALLTVICIVVLLVLRSNNTLAATFAVYAFLLLVVGTVTLGREIHQEG